MHRTNAGEKRKALRRDALELEREARILKKISRMRSEAKIRQNEADKLNAEAEALKRDAKLEDLHLWQMQKIKTSKKGSAARPPEAGGERLRQQSIDRLPATTFFQREINMGPRSVSYELRGSIEQLIREQCEK